MGSRERSATDDIGTVPPLLLLLVEKTTDVLCSDLQLPNWTKPLQYDAALRHNAARHWRFILLTLTNDDLCHYFSFGQRCSGIENKWVT